jgi:hypothetical protein
MKSVWWRKLWEMRARDMAAMSVILLFFILCFGPAILRGRFFIVGDAFIYSYPLRMIAWNAIRHGSLPFWTPLVMSGYPLLSMAQVGIGYPLTWGYLFLPGHWAEEIYVLAPYLLAPAFMYAYVREIGRSRLASLLAGLAFGYGGLAVMGYVHNGMLTNATMWLPLTLIAVERARGGRFIPYLLWATGAFLMSVLTGIGQGFLWVGVLMVAYAVFLAATSPVLDAGRSEQLNRWLSWQRWRPVAVSLGAIVMTVGLAAFQLLETWRAQRLSIRSALSYEIFGEGSFTLLLAWKSLLAPLYVNFYDAKAYVSPLVIVLAVCAGVVFALRKPREVRILFWLLMAAMAWVLMLGANTPLYKIVYQIPLLNLFRVPSRHAFEWTFAISVLAAYGWDALAPVAGRLKYPLVRRQSQEIMLGLILLLAGLIVSLLWWRVVQRSPVFGMDVYTNLPESSYLLWKLAFTLSVLAIAWQGWRIIRSRWRVILLGSAVILSCLVEPFMQISGWWWPFAKPASRFMAVSTATRVLQQYPPELNRTYTRVVLFAEEYSSTPVLDPPNLTALHGLHNVGGYEPLILERYSRALGNVWLDAVTPRPGFKPDNTILDSRSHVLDLLNTRFIVTFLNPLIYGRHVDKEEIKFAYEDSAIELKPGEATQLSATKVEGDVLIPVTTLGMSVDVPQGTPVAKIKVFGSDGQVVERVLRAGVDTAEWAHERPDVRASIRHSLAPIFDVSPGDAENSFPGYRYWSRISLGQRLSVDRVEIVNIAQQASLIILKATLYDSVKSNSMALQQTHYDLNKWQPLYHEDDLLILNNEGALPRAWLVGEAEAIESDEALRRIRGESEHAFDPRRTALLEIPPGSSPSLPVGVIPAKTNARIVEYEPNRLVVETVADTASVLVVSEINYPGWEATLDGQRTPIYTTDYLLRGVILPAGSHRIEMRYTAPAARTGAWISLLTLSLFVGLSVYTRRKSAK